MKFLNVLQSLYCEPWLITPEMHRNLCRIVEAHMTGDAHGPDGIIARFQNGSSGKPTKDRRATVGRMGIVSVNGVIGKRMSDMAKSSGAVDLDDVREDMDACMRDDSIDGVLMDINSAGGTTTGVPEFAEYVREASKRKPVVAYADKLMASAAYWIASPANAIYAARSATVGSIGIYSAWMDESRAMENAGIKMELIKTGKYKGMGMPGTALTQDQRALIQRDVDKVFSWFKGDVLMNRGAVPSEAFEGQTMHAEDAKAMNLIDGVGDEQAALNELAALVEQRHGKK